jgi:hypothetical protein
MMMLTTTTTLLLMVTAVRQVPPRSFLLHGLESPAAWLFVLILTL